MFTINNSTCRGESLVRCILDGSYKSGKTITLLGVSPLNEMVIDAALMAANEVSSPIIFIASLNQVDFDGGYTGWTQRSFVKMIKDRSGKLGLKIPVLIELDHGGPWLKDPHIFRRLSYSDALREVKRSIEEAVVAGYNIIHVDTTVDIERAHLSPSEVAKRTIELIEFSEYIRTREGLGPIAYEIGSDRWGCKDVQCTMELVDEVFRGLRERGIADVDVVFVVGDVDTEVRPGNRLNVDKARQLVSMVSKYGCYLKVHSADYVENPGDFLKIGIGGANIGPMLADVIYRSIKDLLKANNINYRDFINLVVEEIVKDGRWSKYVKSPNDLTAIVGTSDEFKLGLMFRYILNNAAIREYLDDVFSRLRAMGINARDYVVNRIKDEIKKYLTSFTRKAT